MEFNSKAVQLYPWSDLRTDEVARASASGWPAPEMAIISDRIAGESRLIDMELRLARAGHSMQLVLPGDVQPKQFWVEDVAMTPVRVTRLTYKGRYVLTFVGMGENPVKVRLELGLSEPFDAFLVGTLTHLPDSARSLFESRPALASPVHLGDSASLIRQTRL